MLFGKLKLNLTLLLDQLRLVREMNIVVAMISIDAYPFLASSDLTCHLEDTGIGVSWFQCRVKIWKQKRLPKKIQP